MVAAASGYSARQGRDRRASAGRACGRFDCDGQFAYKGERDGCYAAGFYLASEQSHGPRADRSGGHQQDEIDVGLGQHGADLVAWEQQFMGIIGKAEAEMRISDAAQDALRLKLEQALQGEDQVKVARCISAVVVFVGYAHSDSWPCAEWRETWRPT